MMDATGGARQRLPVIGLAAFAEQASGISRSRHHSGLPKCRTLSVNTLEIRKANEDE